MITKQQLQFGSLEELCQLETKLQQAAEKLQSAEKEIGMALDKSKAVSDQERWELERVLSEARENERGVEESIYCLNKLIDQYRWSMTGGHWPNSPSAAEIKP